MIDGTTDDGLSLSSLNGYQKACGGGGGAEGCFYQLRDEWHPTIHPTDQHLVYHFFKPTAAAAGSLIIVVAASFHLKILFCHII